MVSIQNFLTQDFNEPVYVVLNTSQLYESKNGKPFDRDSFHARPEDFVSAFLPFAKVTNIFMNAIFWNPDAPVFFSKEDMRRSDFKIKIIADITCDINGSVPLPFATAPLKTRFTDTILPPKKKTHRISHR